MSDESEESEGEENKRFFAIPEIMTMGEYGKVNDLLESENGNSELLNSFESRNTPPIPNVEIERIDVVEEESEDPTEIVSLENLSEEYQNKVTQFSDLMGGVERSVSFFYLNQNDWNVEQAANSYFGGPEPQVEERDSTSDSDRDNNSDEEQSGSHSSSSFELTKHCRLPFGFGTYNFRRYFGRDEGDSPIEISHDENYFLNIISEDDLKRKYCSFYYILRHNKCVHPKFVPEKIYKQELELEGLTFSGITDFIMKEFDIEPRQPWCRVAESRLWIMFLGSPFLVISELGEAGVLILDFEKRIKSSIDGFCFMLEVRYLSQKYELDNLMDSRSPWQFTRKVLEDPRYINWRRLKGDGRKHFRREGERDVVERIEFALLECNSDPERVLRINIASCRNSMTVPTILFL